MIVYLLQWIVMSANVRIVFDDPTEAATYNMDAVTRAKLNTDTAFLCEHRGGVGSGLTLLRDVIKCEWQPIVQMTTQPFSFKPEQQPLPTPGPTPVSIRIS